ncbi:hypothetical protein [Treponema sp. OMZ 855]|uniref:hypothetical protein n=1 Tax=Treponema sp. OMZ 855 TaxID=1643512 RepID=UPI0020A3416A|nr:hypothetical protein [Treponema sp. OMZ 855]UTC50347.1 hypothetical protein E4N65_09715 [Treponema sp. OMZ 855]
MRKIYIICIAVITMSLTSCLSSARLYILNATDDHILVEVKTIYQVSSDKFYDVKVTYDGLMSFKYKEESSFGVSIALAPMVIKPNNFDYLVGKPASFDILQVLGFGASVSQDADGIKFIDMDKIIKALDTVFIEMNVYKIVPNESGKELLYTKTDILNEKNICCYLFDLKKEIDIDKKYKEFLKKRFLSNDFYIVIREKTEEEKNEN